eukprot:3631868-Alexandrium_andersonii.AAC.1
MSSGRPWCWRTKRSQLAASADDEERPVGFLDRSQPALVEDRQPHRPVVAELAVDLGVPNRGVGSAARVGWVLHAGPAPAAPHRGQDPQACL